MTQPAAGWYPDPADPGRQRYFDGQAWVEDSVPVVGPVPAVAQPVQRGMSRSMKIGLGVGAVVLALVVIGSLGSSDGDGAKPAGSSSTANAAGFTPAIAPNDAAESAPVTAQSGFTPGQNNAITKAEDYLDYTAFSKKGLIEQLEYDQFSTADATFAVEHMEASGGVDWNEQAVKKAKSYLEYTSFSLSALVDQLTYDGFTPSEAQHGANTAYGS